MDFAYTLPGRFSQFPLRNVFSLARSKSDRYPKARKFRANLRNICHGQYLSDVRTGSNIRDDDQFSLSLTDPKKPKFKKHASSSSTAQNPVNILADIVEPVAINGEVVPNALYQLSGHVLAKTIARMCEACSVLIISKDGI